MSARALVLDVGTTGTRAAIVDERLELVELEYRRHPPSVPFEGLVEVDADALAATALDACRAALERSGGPVDAVGVTNQRATTVLWDADTGRAVAPALGWQDLRTIGECITARAERGWAIAPNQSITKLAWLLANTPDLDGRSLRFGTIDSWIAWHLTGGAVHVSDATNASATTTGLRTADGTGWSAERLERFGIDEALLPLVVDSAGVVGEATALDGSPPIAALVGDQQASLVGQACLEPGVAKLTLGTGGVLDAVTDLGPPAALERDDAGTYAIPAWRLGGETTWGVEGIMLSAGTNVEWLRDDLGLIATAEESHDVAATCAGTDGVTFVPAPLGLGTPRWDYGARSTLLGATRGTTRAQVVRAVLEGVAHRAADLVEAAEADTGAAPTTLRVDGGMSRNPTLVRALADATGRTIEVSPTAEATTRGAAFLALLGIGHHGALGDAAALWSPAAVVEPDRGVDRRAERARWSRALDLAAGWHPELSALEF